MLCSVALLVPRLVPGTGWTLKRPFTSLTNTDLHRVIYFNLGSHHVPHSGDIPNTLMHTSASSVMFTPFNFHDRDPSRHFVQGVRLNLGGERPDPQYFGGRYEKDVNLKAVSLTTIMRDKFGGLSCRLLELTNARSARPSIVSITWATPIYHPPLSQLLENVADDPFLPRPT